MKFYNKQTSIKPPFCYKTNDNAFTETRSVMSEVTLEMCSESFIVQNTIYILIDIWI